MKKKTLVFLIIVIVIALISALILFFPVPKGAYDDGGTRVYEALTYKIVVWNRIIARLDENRQPLPPDRYRNTSIFWYPDNQKSLSKLWEMEMAKNPIETPKQQSDTDSDNKLTLENVRLFKEGNIKSVTVTSLPEGFKYSYLGKDADAVVDYLENLNLYSGFEDNPDEHMGMTWEISLEYQNGDVTSVYHFGNSFIRTDNSPWYQMTHEEASRFNDLLAELNN